MTFANKMIDRMASQIRKSNVKLAAKVKPHKITDDDQSIKDGVIYEKSDAGLRSQSEFDGKRKRIPKS